MILCLKVLKGYVINLTLINFSFAYESTRSNQDPYFWLWFNSQTLISSSFSGLWPPLISRTSFPCQLALEHRCQQTQAMDEVVREIHKTVWCRDSTALLRWSVASDEWWFSSKACEHGAGQSCRGLLRCQCSWSRRGAAFSGSSIEASCSCVQNSSDSHGSSCLISQTCS